MQKNTSLELANEFFRLMRQLPRLKLPHTDGLTPSEQELLVILAMNSDETDKALAVSGISRLLHITPAGVTHLLNPLEETGYLHRLPDPRDRRIVRIGLTAKGARQAAALLSDVQENLVKMVNLLGEEDSRTFIRLVSRVIEHFSS